MGGVTRRFCYLVLLLAVALGVALLLLLSFDASSSSYESLDLVYESFRIVDTSRIRGISASLSNRKLEERRYGVANRETKGLPNVNLDDYHPVDPSPNSKAAIKAGPIEHGNPLFPYVPRPTPPSGHPKHMPPAQSPVSSVT